MIALKIIFWIFVTLIFTPKRFYPSVIAGIVPIYALLIWIINRPLPLADDWGELDRAIISIALFIGPLPIIVRFLRGLRHVADPDDNVSWKPAQASCIFVLVWSAAWWLTPAFPILAGSAACFVAALVLTVTMFALATIIPLHRTLFITIGTALITGIAAVLIWPFVIVTAAEKIADGRPYCLVVADGSDYRAANNLLDLTPLVMRGSEMGKSSANFHGQLLTQGESNRNWSYAYRDFSDTSRDHEAPHCKAASGFARNLAWF